MDPRTLRCALQRVARNRGRRTAGVDGVTMAKLMRNDGVERFVREVREALKLQSYQPSPVRRVLLPKPGSPGKYRALGIPTITEIGSCKQQ